MGSFLLNGTKYNIEPYSADKHKRSIFAKEKHHVITQGAEDSPRNADFISKYIFHFGITG